MTTMSFDPAFENKAANACFITKLNVPRGLFSNLLDHLRNVPGSVPDRKSHNFLLPGIMQCNMMFLLVRIHRRIGYTVIHDRFLSVVCGSVAARTVIDDAMDRFLLEKKS